MELPTSKKSGRINPSHTNLSQKFFIMKSTTKLIRKRLPKFETRKDVVERRRKIIRALNRGDRAATKMAKKLAKCATGHPCKLSTCPSCVRRLRRGFILDALRLVEKLQRRGKLPITAFSAVSMRDQYPVGQLHKLDLPLINKRIQRQHQRARFPLVFAGVDISFNEASPPTSPPYWQAQVYGIVVGLGVDAVKADLKRLYHGGPSVPKPLWVRVCSELPAALSYTLKPQFVRRVSYTDDTGRPNTRKCSLKPAPARELALCLGRYQLPVRYALTGCRHYRDRIDLNPGVRKRLKRLTAPAKPTQMTSN
jgi:hypothetical protein